MDEQRHALRGRLLVATPPLVDPNFDRAVVLMLEHGEDGSLGIILNRPSEIALEDVLPEWRAFAASPSVVFTGGPVSPDAVIALGRVESDEIEGWVPLIDDLGAPLDELRVFVGYAGWAPGQLEGELRANAWFVVDLRRDDPFVTTPERLWRDVLKRQRGRPAMFAQYPDDASAN